MHTRRSRLGAALLLSALSSAAWLAAVPVPVAATTTFRVTVHGDAADVDVGDGICDTSARPDVRKCSLRAAIQEANADPDASTIRFRITTGDSLTKTIQLNSALPVITAPLTIDGYTQPGSSENTASTGTNAVIRVEINGAVVTQAGLAATARVTIRGLAVYYAGLGIQLSAGSDGSFIAGNFIGTNSTGTADRGNDTSGILVNAKEVRIGSILREDRNLISGNTTSGIVLGFAARRAVIQGNLIGVRRNGRTALPNEHNGVFITGARGNLIGGRFAGMGNVIAHNGDDGVSLITVNLGDDTRVPTGNRITYNRIFGNVGQGIDLNDDGITPNDPVPDADRGPNGLQNFPRLSSAAGVADGTVIAGQLFSRRDTDFEIQLFASPAGDPEGRTVLTTFTVNTGSDGKVSFNRTVDPLEVGSLVTATATDLERLQTSEISRPVTVSP